MIKYIAHITIELTTPLRVGSNRSDMFQDSPVQRDFNDLPMILGTTITGVLRDRFRDVFADKEDDFFGFSDFKNKDSYGSKLRVTNGLLCDENQKVSEDLLLNKSVFLKQFDNLPLREHTAITDDGSVKEHSKFDEEIIFKGARFKFELELDGDGKEHIQWHNILHIINSDDFRFGGGSTKGFGAFRVVELKHRVLNLKEESDLQEYIEKNPSLNDKNFRWSDFDYGEQNLVKSKFIKYICDIKPDDFFIFGSGYGDDEADNTPKTESIIVWEDSKAKFSESEILIPASSIKGAIAHRVAYHYNLQNSLFIGDEKAKVGEDNEAVKVIFGEKKDTKTKQGQKGKILIGDCFENITDRKIFDHVAIDRFSGGAIDGALFQEKVVSSEKSFKIEILLQDDIADKFSNPFEQALKDIVDGMLPLGGMGTKGHGFFSGDCFKNGVKI